MSDQYSKPVMPSLPGLLGDKDKVLREDDRVDPRIIKVLEPFGLDGAQPTSTIDHSSSLDEQLLFSSETESFFHQIDESITNNVAPVEGIVRSIEVIQGPDGNDIKLYIHKPVNSSDAMPCIYHTHGGGMVILQGSMGIYSHWRDRLSAAGMVVVGVEFRNGAGALGDHPFPAGLSDCMAGLDWVYTNKTQLGISKIILSGESGGGNLALALTLRAKKEGQLDKVQGTYALCPYIYGNYGTKPSELVSLFENDGYFLGAQSMGVLAAVYDPSRENAQNPLCWPYHARVAELEGLPPHVISVNELDPLRDEGLVYFRKLMQAGVDARGRTVNGTVHAADVLFPNAIPEVTDATINDIASFARSL